MRYSIDDAMALFHRWNESASIIRVVFSDVLTGGFFTGVIAGFDEAPPSKLVNLALLAHDDLPLPDNATIISLGLTGTEEIEFTDFAGSAVPVSDTDVDRFLCCLSIQHEIGATMRLCELWPPEGWDEKKESLDMTTPS